VEVSEYEEVRRTRRLKGERRTSNIERRTSNGEGVQRGGRGDAGAVQSDFSDEEMEDVHQVLVGSVVDETMAEEEDFGPVDAGMFGDDNGDDPWAD